MVKWRLIQMRGWVLVSRDVVTVARSGNVEVAPHFYGTPANRDMQTINNNTVNTDSISTLCTQNARIDSSYNSSYDHVGYQLLVTASRQSDKKSIHLKREGPSAHQLFISRVTIMSIAKRNSEAAKAWAEKRRELKERALLMERRSSAPRRSRLSNGEETKMSSKFSASRSHEANTAYIDDFKAGIADMYLALEETSGKTREGGFEPKSQGRAEDITQISSSARSRSAVYDSSGYPPSGHSDKRVPDRTRRRESQQDKGCRSEKISHGKILLANELMKDTAGGGAGDGWYRGPLDPAGHVSTVQVLVPGHASGLIDSVLELPVNTLSNHSNPE